MALARNVVYPISKKNCFHYPEYPQKVAQFLFFASYYSLLPEGLALPFSSWVES